MISHKAIDGLAGIMLGLGAPIGCLFLRMIFLGQGDFGWLKEELAQYGFFYIYMALTTPFVFSLFGLLLGFFRDQVFAKNENLERLAVQLKHEAIMDDLTGLYNRRHIYVELDKEMERSRRYGRNLTGMMVDIDHFKEVNDCYGHLIGDQALRTFGKILSSSVRKIDIVGRYGGDEFLVILPESTLKITQMVAQRIRDTLHVYRWNVLDELVPITASFGLLCLDDVVGVPRVAVMEKIDQALLKAKQAGKDRVVVTESLA